MPLLRSSSSREPTLIQTPIEIDRTYGISSETIRTPLGNTVFLCVAWSDDCVTGETFGKILCIQC